MTNSKDNHYFDYVFAEPKHRTKRQANGSAWWVGAPREGFTQLARQKARTWEPTKREEPHYRILMDRPTLEG